MQAKLVVVSGRASRREIAIKLPMTIGRAKDQRLSILHPTVSRRHCELYERDGLLCVRDLNSANGTFIGEDRITDAVLKPGQRLTIGPLIFEAVYDTSNGASTNKPTAPQARTQVAPAGKAEASRKAAPKNAGSPRSDKAGKPKAPAAEDLLKETLAETSVSPPATQDDLPALDEDFGLLADLDLKPDAGGLQATVDIEPPSKSKASKPKQSKTNQPKAEKPPEKSSSPQKPTSIDDDLPLPDDLELNDNLGFDLKADDLESTEKRSSDSTTRPARALAQPSDTDEDDSWLSFDVQESSDEVSGTAEASGADSDFVLDEVDPAGADLSVVDSEPDAQPAADEFRGLDDELDLDLPLDEASDFEAEPSPPVMELEPDADSSMLVGNDLNDYLEDAKSLEEPPLDSEAAGELDADLSSSADDAFDLDEFLDLEPRAEDESERQDRGDGPGSDLTRGPGDSFGELGSLEEFEPTSAPGPPEEMMSLETPEPVDDLQLADGFDLGEPDDREKLAPLENLIAEDELGASTGLPLAESTEAAEGALPIDSVDPDYPDSVELSDSQQKENSLGDTDLAAEPGVTEAADDLAVEALTDAPPADEPESLGADSPLSDMMDDELALLDDLDSAEMVSPLNEPPASLAPISARIDDSSDAVPPVDDVGLTQSSERMEIAESSGAQQLADVAQRSDWSEANPELEPLDESAIDDGVDSLANLDSLDELEPLTGLDESTEPPSSCDPANESPTAATDADLESLDELEPMSTIDSSSSQLSDTLADFEPLVEDRAATADNAISAKAEPIDLDDFLGKEEQLTLEEADADDFDADPPPPRLIAPEEAFEDDFEALEIEDADSTPADFPEAGSSPADHLSGKGSQSGLSESRFEDISEMEALELLGFDEPLPSESPPALRIAQFDDPEEHSETVPSAAPEENLAALEDFQLDDAEPLILEDAGPVANDPLLEPSELPGPADEFAELELEDEDEAPSQTGLSQAIAPAPEKKSLFGAFSLRRKSKEPAAVEPGAPESIMAKLEDTGLGDSGVEEAHELEELILEDDLAPAREAEASDLELVLDDDNDPLLLEDASSELSPFELQNGDVTADSGLAEAVGSEEPIDVELLLEDDLPPQSEFHSPEPPETKSKSNAKAVSLDSGSIKRPDKKRSWWPLGRKSASSQPATEPQPDEPSTSKTITDDLELQPLERESSTESEPLELTDDSPIDFELDDTPTGEPRTTKELSDEDFDDFLKG